MGLRAEANIIWDWERKGTSKKKEGIGKGGIMKYMYESAAFEHTTFYASI